MLLQNEEQEEEKQEEEEEEETTRKPGTVAASDPDKAKGSQPHVVHIHPPAILYSVPRGVAR